MRVRLGSVIAKPCSQFHLDKMMKLKIGPRVHRPSNNITLDVGKPPSSRGETRKTFTILYHGFKDLSTEASHGIISPPFSCNGEWWELSIFHEGEVPDRYVAVYLYLISAGCVSATFDVGIVNKNGVVVQKCHRTKNFIGLNDYTGWEDFIKRSDIVDPSKAVLDDYGTLKVRVQMKEEPKTAFVPPNPFTSLMKSIFLDEASSDVCFEVSAPVKEEESDVAASDDLFHAHRLVLDTCAPMLAALCGSSDDGEMVVATITDVNPNIFRHLLFYVYGGSVPKDDLREYAKDIIDAADKFSIVNLKLEAEKAYVDSTEITIDNVMDNLLYADAMNCFLLKELAIDFLADNGEELLDNSVSFNDLPEHVIKDVIVAVTRKKKKAVAEVAYDYNKGTFCARALSLMSVSDLRRKLYYLDLDVDGSRETMIEALNNQAIEAISIDEIED